MTAKIVGGVTVALNDGPVRIEVGPSLFDGAPTARLVIGEGAGAVAISVTDSPAETLDNLAEQVARLAAWTRRMKSLKTLPEVA
ncbi:hypothetical protein [Streptomyces spectabilis]|uniref:Uncharacterized protein n=1 Tax=Streptomyces spectabilis TaxID=68270 RepID=A0A5P2X888_STRST|nr:hypothetical protein [Streptomyces spectabilis]MBB5108388.1 hypothetical protein [Streptomyces spectabilis]MCI3901142.1 hypothetical protein [Streptomyces spectabilis]QEV58632.1 hypothetical protein CP982_07780 [Streptomyces spectabilis]GGV46231.1 hypothetical protein GCM10010245_72510 [Streptomyces spectabilis]